MKTNYYASFNIQIELIYFGAIDTLEFSVVRCKDDIIRRYIARIFYDGSFSENILSFL